MNLQSVNQEINIPNRQGIRLYLKREDLLHPVVSGNKFRKLTYNLAFAKACKKQTLLTFGGAYSNHIAATAAAGKLEGFNTIGIIRGEELGENINETLQKNPTLNYAHSQGMQLEFINRTLYRSKEDANFLNDLKTRYPDAYIIPEGGTNELAIKGCTEILTQDDLEFDVVCCAMGTSGTISGIMESSKSSQVILGFPALKGDFFKAEITKWTSRTNYNLISDFHFGGYGRVTAELIDFINDFKETHDILLDPVYTGKMLYGITQRIKAEYFPANSRILAIHTGGLQGIAGMNALCTKKGLPTINI